MLTRVTEQAAPAKCPVRPGRKDGPCRVAGRRARLVARLVAGLVAGVVAGVVWPSLGALEVPGLHLAGGSAFAASAPAGQIRVAAHTGFTRFVLQWPGVDQVRLRPGAGTITLVLPKPAVLAVARPATLPPPLRGITLGPRAVVLAVAGQVALRHFLIGDRLVLDVSMKGATKATATRHDLPMATIGAAAASARLRPPPPLTVPTPAPAPVIPAPAPVIPAPEPPAITSTQIATNPALPGGATEATPGATAGATAEATAGGGAGSGLAPPAAAAAPADGAAPMPTLLPFPRHTGAAQFRLGGRRWMIFDQALTQAGVARLRALPGLAGAEVTILPDATEIALGAAPGPEMGLVGRLGYWLVAADSDPAPAAYPIRPDGRGARITAGAGGRVVMIPNPATGMLLAVGTVLSPDGRVAPARRFATFDLPATELGVAMDALADCLQLRASAAGFVVSADDCQAAAAQPAMDMTISAAAASPVATRSFDLPDEPLQALYRRLQIAQRDAAAAPPANRLSFRRRVAEAMLALGLGNEAGGALAIAAEDDPTALTDSGTEALAAAADVVAHRPAAAAALDGADMPDTDETALWRALRQAELRHGDAAVPPALARALAAGGPLLLAYPQPLRRAFLPLMVGTLLDAGALDAARSILAKAGNEPGLRLCQARALALAGHWRRALTDDAAIVAGKDRLQAQAAAVAALNIRVAHGLMTPAQAADAAEKLTDDWRGNWRERNLWFRIAVWRGQAGQYGRQLEALRAALAAFPDPADGVRTRLDAAFADIASHLVAPKAGNLAPFELVTLLRENHDLLPEGAGGAALMNTLADRLATLDLPAQAAATLQRLLPTTEDPVARVALGTRIAAWLRASGDNAGALAVLRATAPAAPAPPLPAPMADARAREAAAAQAALGQPGEALATLAALPPDRALLARADISEQMRAWQGAAADLSTWLDKNAPAQGALDRNAAFNVLRLASDLAQADDGAGLARLRARFGGRMRSQDDTALFDLLTAPPATNPTDLSGSAAYIRSARKIPDLVRALKPP